MFFFFFDKDNQNCCHIDNLKEDYLNTSKKNTETLISFLKKLIKKLKTDSMSDMHHTSAYYYLLKTIIDDAINTLKESPLPSFEKDDFWSYTVCIESRGLTIYLQKTNYNANEGSTYDDIIQSKYPILECKSNMLTVEQFALFNYTDEKNIRQWIRRGKIKSAVKYGNEWRIPSLAVIDHKSKMESVYYWGDVLTQFPKGYEFAVDYAVLKIKQDKADKKMYHFLFGLDKDMKEIVLNTSEKEKLELWFIGNPLVQSSQEIIYQELY